MTTAAISLPGPLAALCAIPPDLSAVPSEELELAFYSEIERSRKALTIWSSSNGSPSQRLLDIDDLLRRPEEVFALSEHLAEVFGQPAFQQSHERIAQSHGQFVREVLLEPVLVKWLRSTEFQLEKLSAEQGQLLRHLRSVARTAGSELSGSSLSELRELDRRLDELTLIFTSNADAALEQSFVDVSDELQLSGVPAWAQRIAQEDAKQAGFSGFRFKASSPCLSAVLSHADDPELRRRVYLARTRAGTNDPDNLLVATDILIARKRRAELLGFESFADLATSERWMGSGIRARNFIAELALELEPLFEDEREQLLGFAQTCGHRGQLEPWDVEYYAERQRTHLLKIDSEALRKYFPLPQVLDGLFSLVRDLFGIRLELIDGCRAWNSSVLAGRAWDGDRQIGYFYLDLFSRTGKRSGDWMTPLTDGLSQRGDGIPTVAIGVANFAPPGEGEVSLLSHREVVRLFHEVGHLLHHLASQVSFKLLAGVRVAWDLVELPSTVLEMLAWEPVVLRRIARHVKTLEPIHDTDLTRLLNTRGYRWATTLMQDLGHAWVDLLLHSEAPPKDPSSLARIGRDELQRFNPTRLPDGYASLATSYYLFDSTNGYEACYYSYPLAEAMAADVINQFFDGEAVIPGAGHAFKQAVLSRGNSDEPASLFRRFAGRDPDFAAIGRLVKKHSCAGVG